MSDELKPCPFCGATNLEPVRIAGYGEDAPPPMTTVNCVGCGAMAMSVAGWNRRAELARPHHATVAGSLAGHPLEGEHLAAVAAARGEGGGWVAVTERLPRADTRVLVIENDRHGGVYYVASWLGLDDDPEWLDEGTEWMEDGSHERLHPTHWMPLPAPPEEPAPLCPP